jgi:colanic acid/amylovoran biosynthesis glycosyltransferase
LIPTVAHFRAEFARISETFIYDVIVGARGQRPVPVFCRRLYDNLFPLPPDWVETPLDFMHPGDAGALAARLCELGVDACHAHFGYDLPIAAAAAERLGKPVVCSFHGADASSYLRQPYWPDFYRATLPRTAAIVLDYAGMADRLVELGAVRERISVIRTGIDLSFWPLRRHWTKKGPIRLLAVGRLVEKKGYALLLHALARVRREGLDARLTIVGEGVDRRLLSELITAYGFGEVVNLAGLLDRAGIRDLMADFDVFVLPSLTGSDGNEETTPLVLKEAMATGLPVLSTLHGGIPEVVANGVSGILVDEGSIEALAAGLQAMAAERAAWPAMGTAGRAIVEREYNLNLTLDDWARLYASL